MHPLQSVLIALLARADYLTQFLDTSLRADRGGSPALQLVPAKGETLTIRVDGEGFTLARGRGLPASYADRADLFAAIGVGGEV